MKEKSFFKPSGRELSTLVWGLLLVGSLPAVAFEAATLSVSQSNKTAWHNVQFEKPFSEPPVVVMGPLSFNGSDPSTVRVRNVSVEGFQFQIDEWDYRDGAHTTENVSYIAVEPGVIDIDGIPAVAGRIDSIGGTLQRINFEAAFEAPPVILLQVEASNTSPALVARPRRLSETGFQVRIQAEEKNRTRLTPRPVHFIALAPGEYLQSNGQPVIVGTTGDKVTHNWFKLEFPMSLSSPVFLAHMQTADGGNTASLRHRRLGEASVELKVEEEQSQDAEVAHITEDVGFVAIGAIADGDGDGLPDSWERANGLDPNDPSDAKRDHDGDGLNALEEFAEGTDPHEFDGVIDGGLIQITATKKTAFEKELEHGSVQIKRTGSNAPIQIKLLVAPPIDPTKGSVSPDDYQLLDSAGNVLGNLLTLGAGEDSIEILVSPIRDNQVEVPELLRLGIAPSNQYTVGDNDLAEVTIADATNIPENECLFIATVRAENGVETKASGLSTIRLEGDNRYAVVNLDFRDLTSPQTAAHIHLANPVTGPPVESLPIEPVVDHPWLIRAAQFLTTDQETLDALLNGRLYVSVQTSQNPAGEIRGTFRQQEGSVEFSVPENPGPITKLSQEDRERDIARFLTQATFGATPELIREVTSQVESTEDRVQGMARWIDEQMDATRTPPISLLELTQAADRYEASLYEEGDFRLRSHNLRHGWWLMAMKGSDHLRQRVTFALSQIFVISTKDSLVNNRHYGAADYYDMLSRGAFGSYRDLLRNVATHPVMGHYLSHLRNQKDILDDDGNVIVSPDENFAREIMQLFSIGLIQRHPDGTIQLNEDGLPIATYDQTDITEMARVMTGMSFSRRNVPRNSDTVRVNTRFSYGNGSRLFQAQWYYPMTFFERFHDQGEKVLVGGHRTKAFQGGEKDLEVAINALATHPNTAPFISRLLIQRLVSSNPTRGYVYRVASVFVRTEGHLGEVVKAILLDPEARNLEFADRVDAGKQKEPIIRYLALCRALNVKSNLPIDVLSAHEYPTTERTKFPRDATFYRMGNTDNRLSQTPQSAPTVFNWFLPDFTVAGPLAAAGLVAPEFQVTTESQVVNAANANFTLLFNRNGQGGLRLPNQDSPHDENLIPDFSAYDELVKQAEANNLTPNELATLLVDFTDLILSGGSLKHRSDHQVGRTARDAMIEAVAKSRNNKVKTALYLYTTSPEYIVQK